MAYSRLATGETAPAPGGLPSIPHFAGATGARMSDQKKWFKVWNSILTDPSFLDLPIEQIGRWTLLGALISLHGENGQITLSHDALCKLLRVQNDNGLMLPNVAFKRDESDNGMITVIMKNWLKYQLDSTGYERLKKFRKSKMITVQDKTKIRLREDNTKSREEKKILYASEDYSELAKNQIEYYLNTKRDFYSKAYPGISLDQETQKAIAWVISNPKNRKTDFQRYLNGWLSRAQNKINLYPPREDKFL